MAKQVLVKQSELPEGWSVEAADFTNRVLIQFLLFSYYKESLQIELA
jgi:hypothetical protein